MGKNEQNITKPQTHVAIMAVDNLKAERLKKPLIHNINDHVVMKTTANSVEVIKIRYDAAGFTFNLFI